MELMNLIQSPLNSLVAGRKLEELSEGNMENFKSRLEDFPKNI